MRTKPCACKIMEQLVIGGKSQRRGLSDVGDRCPWPVDSEERQYCFVFFSISEDAVRTNAMFDESLGKKAETIQRCRVADPMPG